MRSFVRFLRSDFKRLLSRAEVADDLCQRKVAHCIDSFPIIGLATHMFKAIDVWRRLENGGLARFRCFEVLPNDGYCVHSVDFYDEPLDAKRMQEFDRQFIELLLEPAPNSESETYPTLEEAIANHELDFRQFEDDIELKRNKI